MRVPLRAFSFDLPIRKKSSGGSNSSNNSNNKHLNLSLGHNHDHDHDHHSDKSPPTTPTSPTTKTRRGSAGRLLSKASQLRLRVTARASSLDLLHTHSSSRSPPPPNHPHHSHPLASSSTPTSTKPSRKMSDLLGGSFSSTTSTTGIDDIDLDRAASAFPDIGIDGSGDFDIPTPGAATTTTTTAQASTISFDDFDEPLQELHPKVTDVKVTGDDEIERFEDQFPDIGGGPAEVETPVIAQKPSFGASSPFAPRPQPSSFTSTPILQQPLPDEEEPEVIKEWREKQAAEIKARDEASQARRQEAISKAERSIDQFYEDYNAKKERNIKENKLQEQEYLSSFSESLSAGTTWSRICEYVELQNSQSKTLARTGAGTTDLTRFKEVLLRLKREGEAAPGAAGY